MCLGRVGVVMADEEAGNSEGDCGRPRFIGKPRMNFILKATEDYSRCLKLAGDFDTPVLQS